MARTKQTSKRKRWRRGVPPLGAAGVSLVMAGGASANAPTANVPPLQDTSLPPVVALDEEEIADVSLATFYIFDKENVSHLGQGIRLAAADAKAVAEAKASAEAWAAVARVAGKVAAAAEVAAAAAVAAAAEAGGAWGAWA
jgi:uncharacterized alpha-E superfamily protein